MMISVEGVYRDGKVELKERPAELLNGTRVVVTFVLDGSVDLKAAAAEVRSQLAAFLGQFQ